MAFSKEMLGLKIDRGKCCVLGINSEEEKIKRWVDFIGCEMLSFLSSFLGLPLGNNPKSIDFWDLVVDKFVGCQLCGKRVLF